MRVIIWTDSDRFAGTERHCFDLHTGLREIGVDSCIGARVGSPLAAKVSENGGGWESLDASRAPVRSVQRLASLLRQRAVDVVHAHNGVAALLSCAAVARAGRGAVVATQHFIKPARSSRRGLPRLASQCAHHWMSARISRWIAISGAVAAAMTSRGDASFNRIRLIHNGVGAPPAEEPDRVSARSLLGIEENTRLILCAARLEPEKGHSTLLNALAMLGAENIAFRACLIGDGSLKSEIQRRIDTLGLQQSVRLEGHQQSPGTWMRASDLLVLPSPDEPFGLVLTEAMSRGVPVIAAAAGGPLEIVNSECGLLFTPEDNRDLARKLQTLLLHPELRSRLGSGGLHRWRSRFNLSRMAQQVAAVYREALQNG